MSGSNVICIVIANTALLDVGRLRDLLPHYQLLYQCFKFAARVGRLGCVRHRSTQLTI